MNFIACDCGNSSIRVNLCKVKNGKITVKNIASQENKQILVSGYFYWDMLNIFDFIKQGIALGAKEGKIHGVGICTWGIDFMLFDEKNNMLSNSLSYRNTLGASQLRKLSEAQQGEMFYKTGILCDKINTVFMLKAMMEKMPKITSAAHKLLLVPDILNYFLTGVMQNEPSELSTSQLMDTNTMKISKDICKAHNIDDNLFCKIGVHGTLVGNILPDILRELKIDYDIPVICVPSHDTASAVLGVPSREKEFAFISAGTWALIGADCEKPIINEKTLKAGMTNEVGAFGRITLLKNSIGMFILQRLKKEYEEKYGKLNWDNFLAQEENSTYETLLYNVNNERFFNPNSMYESICMYLVTTNQVKGKATWADVLLATHYSMAASYCLGIKDTQALSNKSYDKVYVVGGGAKNQRINSHFADILGQSVITCGDNSASVGNAAVQLCYYEPSLTMEDLKELIVNSIKTQTFEPKLNKQSLLENYGNLPNV